MNRVLSILMTALVLVASVGAAPVPKHQRTKTTVTSKAKDAHTAYQIGNASWYGKSFHGRTTASGEDFDMFELTAAHRQLPLGSYVKVTNLRNGKWVIVLVNDRGPYIKNRILDLSYGAARMLEFHRGVEKVRLDLVEPETVAAAQNSLAGSQ
jgi:rare lipoprotein A (peptidoglycan hydrolase)